MEIPSLSKDEVDAIMTLATRFDVLGKSTLFLVPAYVAEDDPEVRGRLIEKAAVAQHLTELEFLIDVTTKADFENLIKTIKETKKRDVKIYLLSPVGLAMYHAVPDQWTDEMKADYTKEQERYVADSAHSEYVAGVDAEITALKDKLKK